jgi:prepilin-type N-terminal cleavage/methylation domain-containing protein
MSRGFTLIETIVYLALLGILLTGAILASYQLLTGSYALDAKNTAGEEGGFVLRKLNWAFGSASSIEFVSTSPVVFKVVRTGSPVAYFKFSGTAGDPIQMDDGTGYADLTTPNVSVSSLSFTNIPSVGSSPQGVTAEAVINGITFSLTRYLRR